MTPVNYCPNCGGSVTANNVGQADCPNCGLKFSLNIYQAPKVGPIFSEPKEPDFWQETTELIGVKIDRDELARLDSLLCLCRVMGLNYRVRPSNIEKDIVLGSIGNWPFQATVGYTNWPVDFYAPITRNRTHGRLDKTPSDALIGAISDAIRYLLLNAEAFSHLFQENWEANLGNPWSADTEPGVRFEPFENLTYKKKGGNQRRKSDD